MSASKKASAKQGKVAAIGERRAKGEPRKRDTTIEPVDPKGTTRGEEAATDVETEQLRSKPTGGRASQGGQSPGGTAGRATSDGQLDEPSEDYDSNEYTDRDRFS